MNMEQQPSLTTFLESVNATSASGDSGYGGSECCSVRFDDNDALMSEKLTVGNLSLEENEGQCKQQMPQIVTREEEEQHIRYLIQAFTPDLDGDTYLHILPTHNMLNETRTLIQYCPDPQLLDMQNKDKQAPIHVVTVLDLAEEIKLLIQKNASMELVDVDGKNIIHLCAERGHTKSLKAIIQICKELDKMNPLFELLKATNNSGCTPFYTAVLNKQKEICDILVQSIEGLDVNAVDVKNGNSPLHEAVMMRDADLTLSLLKYCKLDVNFQNKQNVTPLHVAACKGDEAICAILLQYDAQRDLKDSNGNAPYVYAANERILEYLKV